MIWVLPPAKAVGVQHGGDRMCHQDKHSGIWIMAISMEQDKLAKEDICWTILTMVSTVRVTTQANMKILWLNESAICQAILHSIFHLLASV